MIDKKDKKIIEHLQRDARQPIRRIAKKTKIRPSTVHNRMQKLIENNIIERFTVQLNHEKIGDSLVVFILAKTNKNIPDSYFRNKPIKGVFGITGQYDLILKCRFKDIEEFNAFILDLRNREEVRETLTLIGTLTLKEEL